MIVVSPLLDQFRNKKDRISYLSKNYFIESITQYVKIKLNINPPTTWFHCKNIH